jgi:hypothetical protein
MGNDIASLLTRDGTVAGESQARFAGDEHFMQGAECRKTHAGLADRQPGAKYRVKLPARDQAYAAGGQIDMCDDTDAAALKLDAAHPLPIKRMPSVMHNNICLDMGRMTARWL